MHTDTDNKDQNLSVANIHYIVLSKYWADYKDFDPCESFRPLHMGKKGPGWKITELSFNFLILTVYERRSVTVSDK